MSGLWVLIIPVASTIARTITHASFVLGGLSVITPVGGLSLPLSVVNLMSGWLEARGGKTEGD